MSGWGCEKMQILFQIVFSVGTGVMAVEAVNLYSQHQDPLWVLCALASLDNWVALCACIVIRTIEQRKS